MREYAAQCQALVAMIDRLRTYNDWIVQDPTMLDRYFGQTPDASRGEPRTDITKADVTAAKDAIGQVIFAYDSGAPTQKSAILKMIP